MPGSGDPAFNLRSPMMRRVLLLAILFPLLAPLLRAEWTAMNVASNLSINCLVVHGTELYAGTSAGVFVTSDQGAGWRPLNGGLIVNEVIPSVLSIAVWGDTLIAGTDGRGMFRSINGGASWYQVPSSPVGLKVPALAVGSGGWIAGATTGLFRSVDGGVTWQATALQSPVAAIAQSGDVIAAGGKGGVFVTSDDGASWRSSKVGLLDTTIRALSMAGNLLIAISGRSGVFRSIDAGLTWSASNSGLTITEFNGEAVSVAAYAAVAVVGSSSGVYVSTDDGAHWAATAALPKANAQFQGYKALALTSAGNLFAGAYGDNEFVSATHGLGVYSTGFQGGEWAPTNAGLSFNSFYLFGGAAAGTFVYAGTGSTSIFDARTALYRSSDDGGNWSGRDQDQITSRSLVASGDTLIAGTVTYSADKSGIALSTDFGTSWVMRTELSWRTLFSTAFDSKMGVAAFMRNGDDVVVALQNSAVYHSTDLGTTWTAALTGPTDQTAMFLADGVDVLAATVHGVFRTTDRGMHWAADTAGMGGMNVNALVMAGSTLLAAAGRTSTGGAGSGIWAHEGGHWVQRTGGLPAQLDVNDLLAVRGAIVAASSAGVFVSHDAGGTWREVRHRSDDAAVTTLAATNDYLYVTSLTGVFRSLIDSVLNGVDGEIALLRSADLLIAPNYPEPFAMETVIAFTLRAPSIITLRIYDDRGTPVASIARGKFASGAHNAVWNAAEMRCGAYWCVLSANGREVARRITVVR
jgi:photosystem II stability/assembly factor-like uncharacterized protein